VIGRQGTGARELIRRQKLFPNGVGVERLFQPTRPMIDKIEVAKQGKVRRAKLYFLRELRGKARQDQRERARLCHRCGATQAEATDQK